MPTRHILRKMQTDCLQCMLQARKVRHHTLAEFRREVAVSAIAFHPMSESSGSLPPPPSPHSPAVISLTLHHHTPSSVGYPAPTKEADNELVAPLRLRVSKGCGDRLLSVGSRCKRTCYPTRIGGHRHPYNPKEPSVRFRPFKKQIGHPMDGDVSNPNLQELKENASEKRHLHDFDWPPDRCPLAIMSVFCRRVRLSVCLSVCGRGRRVFECTRVTERPF
ncbi:hypothetical protein EVAR_96512_1 [Eumeta japonica]|uniref:Uncharacterized protein n=1 Tax=Eumeta variegata TaxID=151549 RepID=A0A4C1WGF4_EUMVA|nr:hypothetical protein EVAR_96512_1 [Eumeta japonica]